MSAMRFMCLTASMLLALVISPAVAEWRSSPGDAAAHRHFSGDRITAETVGDLAPLELPEVEMLRAERLSAPRRA